LAPVIYAREIRDDGSVAGCTVLVVDVSERKQYGVVPKAKPGDHVSGASGRI
jgi:hypothetical protein